jgi:hypothetical protein
MDRIRRIAMAKMAAAISLVALVCSAAPGVAGDESLTRFLLFSGFDLWRHGGFLHGGVLYAPRGLAQEGPVIKLLVGGGQYQYLSGTTTVTGRQWLLSALPGWRFKRDKFELTVYGGLDLQNHRFSPNDTGNALAGTHAGLRAGFDLWWEPRPAMMVAASASASTIGTSYWARGAVGWWTFDRVWLGPEVVALGDDNYRQFRIGVHLTGLRTATFEWAAAAGFARDNDNRSGPYVRVGLIARR